MALVPFLARTALTPGTYESPAISTALAVSRRVKILLSASNAAWNNAPLTLRISVEVYYSTDNGQTWAWYVGFGTERGARDKNNDLPWIEPPPLPAGTTHVKARLAVNASISLGLDGDQT